MKSRFDYTKYIGIPFKLNGREDNAVDCYGLVRLLYRDLYSVNLPEVVTPELIKDMAETVRIESLKWKSCEIKEGAVLVFNIMGYGSHVGFAISDTHFIHTWQGTGGVVIEKLDYWKKRIVGVYEYEE